MDGDIFVSSSSVYQIINNRCVSTITFLLLTNNEYSIHRIPMNKVQMKWHLIGLNNLMDIVVMDRRQYYRKNYAQDYTEEKYIEHITQEFVALDKFVVFGERYGNELLKKLKGEGGTRRSLWFEKDPDIANDCLFSEKSHMKYTRYSSKTLLNLAQMSTDTNLSPRFCSLFSMRHDNQLPTTGDDIAQTLLQEATNIDLSSYEASYTDGRTSTISESHTPTSHATLSSSTSASTGKRKDSSELRPTTVKDSDTTLNVQDDNERHFMITGKYSRIQAYRVVFRDGKKTKSSNIEGKKNSKNQKAQLANISQALIRFFVKSKVLHFHNQDLTSVFVKCDNTDKLFAGTLHCYEKMDNDSQPMYDHRSDNSDEEDESNSKGTFKFKYDNIDNCYEWKIALSKSQNDIYLQTEMVADIVCRDGTSMKPYVTFPILPKQSAILLNEDTNYKRNCVEEER